MGNAVGLEFVPHLVAQEAKALSDRRLVVFLDTGHGAVNIAQNGQHATSEPHAAVLNELRFFTHHSLANVLNLRFFVGDFLLGEFGSLKRYFKGVALLFGLFSHLFRGCFVFGNLFHRNGVVNRRFFGRLVGHHAEGVQGGF